MSLTSLNELPVETREEYRALQTLALHMRLDPGAMLLYLAKIYSDEADRLDKIFFENDMPPALAFQYQHSIRHFKSLAKKVRATHDLVFAELVQSEPSNVTATPSYTKPEPPSGFISDEAWSQ